MGKLCTFCNKPFKGFQINTLWGTPLAKQRKRHSFGVSASKRSKFTSEDNPNSSKWRIYQIVENPSSVWGSFREIRPLVRILALVTAHNDSVSMNYRIKEEINQPVEVERDARGREKQDGNRSIPLIRDTSVPDNVPVPPGQRLDPVAAAGERLSSATAVAYLAWNTLAHDTEGPPERNHFDHVLNGNREFGSGVKRGFLCWRNYAGAIRFAW